MSASAVWNILPLLLGLFGTQPSAVGQSVTRLIIQDEVIIRVPVQPHPLLPQVEWLEQKGPKCIAAGEIQRALLSSDVDTQIAQAANDAKTRNFVFSPRSLREALALLYLGASGSAQKTLSSYFGDTPARSVVAYYHSTGKGLKAE